LICFVIGKYLITADIYIYNIRKVKAIPLKAWTGPEDARMLRLTDFKIIGT
jgi:hypothetical protein